MKFTVFGGSGFIGRQLVDYLEEHGHQVFAIRRGVIPDSNRELGHVIYAIGLTGDFRSRPFDTVEAHVCQLSKLLRVCNFESWLYLSSTRIYSGLPSGIIATEEIAVPMMTNADNLYDLSKMLGESLCITQEAKNVRVARLSNVYGRGQSTQTFLGSILNELRMTNTVIIDETSESCKDYVFIDEVIPLLVDIATRGSRRIYNVASGQLTTHLELTRKLTELTGCQFLFRSNGRTRAFPQIAIKKSQEDFDFLPSLIINQLDLLIQ